MPASTVVTAAPHMTVDEPEVEQRQRYENALVSAMRFAERHLPRDEALEVAHDVASAMLRLPVQRVTEPLIYFAVTRKIRNYWRARQRRSAREGTYHESWSSIIPVWAQPDAEIETIELQEQIAATLADMPTGMRKVFTMIREQGLSYKEAASELGIAVGTVHTQLSRAIALLRESVAQYQAGVPRSKSSTKAQQP